MEQVERHARLMRKEVQLEHIQREEDLRKQQLEHFQRSGKYHILDEYERIKISLAPKVYDEVFYRISGQTCEGTGSWLLSDDGFKRWLDVADTSSKILWLQGIPGAGMYQQPWAPQFHSADPTQARLFSLPL